MKVIGANNVNMAFWSGIRYLEDHGVERDSRNGKVLMAPEPVCTVYTKPNQRVLFDAERNCNPFFHLIESIWMLSGGQDVQSLSTLVKRMETYSDDGETFHGAYGHRWRRKFTVKKFRMEDFANGAPDVLSTDQLAIIIENLKKDPNDRRQVLQIWDAKSDLGVNSKDIPCNLTVHFQISVTGELDMTVFNRSNDIIWGCYGANAVHFSMLQEYIASELGVPIGFYRQISDNYHAYVDVFEDLRKRLYANSKFGDDPYSNGSVVAFAIDFSLEECQEFMKMWNLETYTPNFKSVFIKNILCPMAEAYHEYKRGHIETAIKIVEKKMPPKVDWTVASLEWLQRIQTKRRNSQ